MASQKSARRSRKRRRSAGRPRAVSSPRRERVDARRSQSVRAERGVRASTYGERPPSVFGGLPVSELAILVGVLGAIVGFVSGAPPALFAGLGACFIGVLEVTAREHFSGYRSHATLLAGMVAVLVESGLALLLVGRSRALLLIVVVPVFASAFSLLRRRFKVARQARVRAIPRA